MSAPPPLSVAKVFQVAYGLSQQSLGWPSSPPGHAWPSLLPPSHAAQAAGIAVSYLRADIAIVVDILAELERLVGLPQTQPPDQQPPWRPQQLCLLCEQRQQQQQQQQQQSQQQQQQQPQQPQHPPKTPPPPRPPGLGLQSPESLRQLLAMLMRKPPPQPQPTLSHLLATVSRDQERQERQQLQRQQQRQQKLLVPQAKWPQRKNQPHQKVKEEEPPEEPPEEQREEPPEEPPQEGGSHRMLVPPGTVS